MGINENYLKMVNDLYYNGETRFPRGLECKEIRPYIFKLDDPNDNIITIPGLETNIDYAKEELRWYINGNGKIDFSPKIEKVWSRYSDDGVKVNSNYGERIFGKHENISLNQWEWVKDLLIKDPDSRQAIININSYFDKDKPTKDFPCTLDIQYFKVGNSLESIVHMRSNDVFLGFRNDVYCFTEFQKMLANELNLKLGSYTHIANSMHLYKKDYEKVRK